MGLKPEEISSVIKELIKNYDKKLDTVEVGSIIEVGDGIARVYGLDNAMAGELLELPGGVYAMALNLEQDNIGCVLLGSDKNFNDSTSSFNWVSFF